MRESRHHVSHQSQKDLEWLLEGMMLMQEPFLFVACFLLYPPSWKNKTADKIGNPAEVQVILCSGARKEEERSGWRDALDVYCVLNVKVSANCWETRESRDKRWDQIIQRRLSADIWVTKFATRLTLFAFRIENTVLRVKQTEPAPIFGKDLSFDLSFSWDALLLSCTSFVHLLHMNFYRHDEDRLVKLDQDTQAHKRLQKSKSF